MLVGVVMHVERVALPTSHLVTSTGVGFWPESYDSVCSSSLSLIPAAPTALRINDHVLYVLYAA